MSFNKHENRKIKKKNCLTSMVLDSERSIFNKEHKSFKRLLLLLGHWPTQHKCITFTINIFSLTVTILIIFGQVFIKTCKFVLYKCSKVNLFIFFKY